jgi:hypothetical protein
LSPALAGERLTSQDIVTKVRSCKALCGQVNEAIMRHHHGRILLFDGDPPERALSAGASISTTTMTTKTSRRAAGVM